LQSVSGGEQVAAQWPLEHFSDPVQAVAQPPQWERSVRRFTQVPPQSTSGGVQLSEQWPAKQTWSAVQALAQVPQWSWVV
jgi:hypothetical protein